MKFFMDLSKREKILIYILTLLLILFVYLNFIREALLNEKNAEAASYMSKDDYQILLAEYNKEKSNFDKNSLFLEGAEGPSNNFGKNLDLEKLSQDGPININSFNISNVMMEKRKDLNVFYIDKNLLISDSLENIESFLSLITSNDELYLRNISINRLDENNFEANITVREYTLKEVPYTGINYKYNNKSNNSLENGDQSLLAALYGKEEEEVNLDYSRSSSSSGLKKANKAEDVTKSEDKDIIEEEKPEENAEVNKEEIPSFNYIDDNNKKYNQNLRIGEESFYFNSDFISANLDKLADISNVNELKEESTNEILEFEFRNKLVLSDFDIKFSYNVYKISFELNGPNDLKGKIYFLDDTKTLYTVDFTKLVDGYEAIDLYLDKNYKYPLSFQSIVTDNYVWEDLSFRNLLLYED